MIARSRTERQPVRSRLISSAVSSASGAVVLWSTAGARIARTFSAGIVE